MGNYCYNEIIYNHLMSRFDFSLSFYPDLYCWVMVLDKANNDRRYKNHQDR